MIHYVDKLIWNSCFMAAAPGLFAHDMQTRDRVGLTLPPGSDSYSQIAVP